MWLRDRKKGVRNKNPILTWARAEQRGDGEDGAEDDEQRRRAGTIRSD